jgi:hypothetical protein
MEYVLLCVSVFLPFFWTDENTVENSDGKTPVDDVRPVVELLPLVFRLIDGRIVGNRQLLKTVLKKPKKFTTLFVIESKL